MASKSETAAPAKGNGSRISQGEPHTQRLMKVLLDEDRVYEKLLELFQGQRQAIISGHVDELYGIVSKEEQLMGRIGELEADRIAIVEALAKKMSLDSAGLTVSELSQMLSETEAAQFTQVQRRILSRIDQLSQVNRRNARLIKSSLELVSAAIQNLLGAYPGGALYNGGGKPQGASRSQSQILDRRA